MSKTRPMVRNREVAYRVLANPRQRRLLTTLAERGRDSVDGLVEAVTRRECLPDDDAEDRRRVRRDVHVSLVHVHLPMVADHGLIEYDRDEGDVALLDGSGSAAFEGVLELAVSEA
ncbi:DUF7344 domain-containing protein [Natronosalvus rutilus]|uniref:DUF7344 domain-containing protein n=1 Tax=Natronosalvus rutilus TaxID=2953753 RepID=A0A9E7NA59_9EURY|nr:hypothetical protein [Natronosalvus rutilus]UTF53676.1 hypothetical protein NGM29_18220 [Natronosalvus rutilus]